ncbi:uncharacterized protein LOC111319062 [Stylophora pistillata]|uniref:uncharacterized protein LOC111319062 n=1 Tax=Stylophora pistillata TaxID=50429 RepID=UPI000C03A1FB|nr:uncharacterized protein LOC111319062 [Stylophora pistillata]
MRHFIPEPLTGLDVSRRFECGFHFVSTFTFKTSYLETGAYSKHVHSMNVDSTSVRSMLFEVFPRPLSKATMNGSLLFEVFGRIAFSITRGVTEHYNPDEPEVEIFGYDDTLSRDGREWNCQPVDKPIYQEYSPPLYNEYDLLSVNNFRVRYRLINASSPDESEDEQQDGDDEMAWKRFRPSVLRTVCQSMCTGFLISLSIPVIIGLLYIMISYLSYETARNCEFQPKKTIPVKIQWIRTLSDVIGVAFLYMWFFVGMFFVFRPYQLKGIRRKLILFAFVLFCVEALCRVLLQVFGVSHSQLSVPLKIPFNVLFVISIICQVILLTYHFRNLSSKICLFIKMITPSCFTCIIGIFSASFIYPLYNKQNEKGKLLIALFLPLPLVIFKVISRHCAQRLQKIIHPGYSYSLLVPLYFGSAIMFRVLQADLENLRFIALLGAVHGAAEVLERSTMVFIDHICHVIWKRHSAPWGSFRTPRCERLMADIIIMSMLYESTAIVSVNGLLYLYQLVYLQNVPLSNLRQKVAIHTLVALAIEWFFTSVSLAIETRFQNIAVMAVWRKRWKRHILVAMANVIPLAIWTSTNLLVVVHGRFPESKVQSCKMPFA